MLSAYSAAIATEYIEVFGLLADKDSIIYPDIVLGRHWQSLAWLIDAAFKTSCKIVHC